MQNLSREELFLWIAVDQTVAQVSGVDVGAAIAVLAGQPILPTRAKFKGATVGTSLASVTARRLFRQKLPIALPMLTGSSLTTLRISFTRNLGALIGRAIPGVGWVILAYDATQIIRKTIARYNALAKAGDKLW